MTDIYAMLNTGSSERWGAGVSSRVPTPNIHPMRSAKQSSKVNTMQVSANQATNEVQSTNRYSTRRKRGFKVRTSARFRRARRKMVVNAPFSDVFAREIAEMKSLVAQSEAFIGDASERLPHIVDERKARELNRKTNFHWQRVWNLKKRIAAAEKQTSDDARRFCMLENAVSRCEKFVAKRMKLLKAHESRPAKPEPRLIYDIPSQALRVDGSE